MKLDDWFLTAAERGNPATDIDRRRGDATAWTRGNQGRVLVHGATYFARLYEQICSHEAGDLINFTDWRGDPDERLAGAGTEVARVLADAARRGIQVRGLVWRSHPDQAHFSEQENLHLVETINEAGGEVLLDERVGRFGSHHQKLFVLRRPGRSADDVAFVGGIDLCHGRADDHTHRGDPQAIKLDDRYGERPAWHDIQLEVRGPAVGDLAHTFRERWEDPTPVDHRNPWRRWLTRLAREPSRPDPLPPEGPYPPARGTLAIQVLRTYAARRHPYPFAPEGERSIARAYLKVFARASRVIYVEDQYLWSAAAADALVRALERSPQLRIIVIVPRFPDRDGRWSGPPYRIGQEHAMKRVSSVGGDRVAVYDLESESGWPIYVHAKVCIIDDVWMIVGSDNLNRRSWTNDSELSCAIIDEEFDEREPTDLSDRGDGARRFARATRLQLWREHLGRPSGSDSGEEAESFDDDIVDPDGGAEVLRRSAQALDEWHEGGRVGPRPVGRLRIHRPEPLRRWERGWSQPLYEFMVDPDGRPRRLRRDDGY